LQPDAEAEEARIATALAPQAAARIAAARAWIGDHDDAWIAGQLGIARSFPKIRSTVVAVRGSTSRGENVGHAVFRVRGTLALVGAFWGGIALAAVALAFHHVAGRAAALWMIGGIVAGGVIGRARRHDVCSDRGCKARLPQNAEVCPRCGGRIAGTIAHENDRLEAEEDESKRG
jgi:hypothetical protein